MNINIQEEFVMSEIVKYDVNEYWEHSGIVEAGDLVQHWKEPTFSS